MTTELWWFAMNKSADARTLGICLSKWLLMWTCWQLHPSIWLFARGWGVFVMWLSAFYVATMVHNAMHRDVFTVQGVETTWRVILSATFGFPVEAYKPTHNLNHHVHTQHEEDHLHTSQMKYRSPLLNLLMFFPTVYPGISKLENEFIRKEFHKRSWRFVFFVVQVMAAHGTTLALLALDWRRGLLYWLIPNLLAVDAIITMNMLQHDGCDMIVRGEHRGSNMEINSARNFVGPVINWFTCNNGYHTIHHMFSTVHWTEYPALHAKLVEPHIDPALNEKCIVRYIWRTYIWPGLGPMPLVRNEGTGQAKKE